MKVWIALPKDEYDALVNRVGELEVHLSQQTLDYNVALADAHRENSLLERERDVAERERDLLQDELDEIDDPWPHARMG